jgi:hygromycin-B 7''-O-kinase
MHSLPKLNNIEAFRAWRADPLQCLPAALDIARSHGLPHRNPHLFATGTNLVVALDDGLILKIFPPALRNQFISERLSLSQLRGTEAWPALPEDQKERILAQIGETIAEVQRVPLDGLSEIEPRWDQFIAQQISGCRARHERLGLPRKYLDGLDDLLRDVPSLIPLDAPPVILTGEYIPQNFLLSQQNSGWRLTGLIDFGDVMTGWGEYDLLGPSAFMTAGMPRRVRSLFEGFGYSKGDMNPALQRRLMALLLLHRASDPVRHICIEGWQQRAGDLLELQQLLWPL